MLFCAALALAGASCGGGDDDPETQPTTTQLSTTTTTQSQEEEDEQALRQLAEDWTDAIRAIYYEGEDVALAADYAAGEYLEAFEGDVEAFAQSGNSARPDERTNTDIESVEVSGDSAEVTQCTVDFDVLLGPGGEVLNDDVVARRFVTTADRGSDGWRFTARDELEVWEGSESCHDS
jgi:hypothetical protein